MRTNSIGRGKDDIIFDIVNNTLLLIVFIAVLYPLIFVVIASISSPDLVNSGKVLLIPKGITFEGFKRIFVYGDIWMGYKNTIIYVVFGTLTVLFFTFTAAYPLSREDFIGKKIIVFLFTFTMFFSGGLIPYYMVVRDLHLVNTAMSQIFLGAVGFWYIVIARTFIQKAIPNELKEAAFIDGCSHIRMFTRIILPLSKPIIAVIALYSAVALWNGFFNALIFVTDRKLYPLQLILREILVLNQIDFKKMPLGAESELMMKNKAEAASLIKYAVIIVSTLPIIMVYPFLQKYFVQGVMIGSLKG